MQSIRTLRNTLAILALTSAAGSAHAQTLVWSNVSGGLWNNALNWTPTTVPTNAAQIAEIGVAGSYAVDLNISPALLGLNINNPNATLRTLAGTSLTLTGSSLANAGVIVVNSAALNAGTFLQCSADCSFTGNGTLQLNANPANLDTAYLQTSGGARVTNAAGHTISGNGRVYALLTNDGLISTSGAGNQLQYLSNPKTNNNLIRAQNNATTLLSVSLTQGPGGIILADNATTSIASIALTGGRLQAINGGSTIIAGGPTFNLAASSGPLIVPGGSAIVFASAGHRHDGVITVNSNAANAATYLQFNASGTLRSDTGSCQVVLNANPANLDTAYLQTANNSVLTLDPTCTVTGNGRVHANIVNNSTITAVGSGNQMGYVGAPKTNNGLFLAQNGATNSIGVTITQGPTGIIRADNATNTIASVALTGGRLEAVNGGSTIIAGGPTFNLAASSGPVTIPGGAAVVFASAGHRHDGVITVNSNAANAATYLQFNANGTLRSDTGVCQVVLNANPANLDTAYLQTANNSVLTLDPTCTVTGNGRIHANIVNNSTITTSGVGNQIGYVGSPKANNGLFLAQNGASNSIGVAITQGSTGIIRADNATNNIAGIALTGGRVEATNGGSTVISGGVVFNLGASTGPINVAGGSAITFTGTTQRHDGVITVNSNAANAATYLQFNASSLLRGDASTCRVVLNANPANLDTAYLQTANSSGLTTDPTTTISGRGRIYARTVIAGTLAPGFAPSTTASIEGRNAIDFSDSARLEIKVAGFGAGQFDRFASTNSVLVNGTLAVTLLPSYTPAVDDAFVVVSGSVVNGRFDALEAPALSDPLLKLAVRYTSNQAILFVTCKGNFNSDDIIDFFDYLDFASDFAAEDPKADINGDNQVDFFDYLDFVALLDACGA